MSNLIPLRQVQSSQITLAKPAGLSSPTRFGHAYEASPEQSIVQAILHEVPKNSCSEAQLLKAVQNGQPLPLPKGYRYDYGIICNGKLQTTSAELQALIMPMLKSSRHSLSSSMLPVILKVKSPQSNQAFNAFLEQVLKKEFSYEYKNPKTDITTNNVILSDLLEKLISGNTEQGLPKAVAKRLNQHLNGEIPAFHDLKALYQVEVPGNRELTKALNQNLNTRRKLIGLELAQKLYAESQEVEWHSIALSLILGAAGEPTINAIFKDGGPVASAVRTGFMSGIDITGNVLSVMGVVNENLKARNQKLSVEAVFGPKTKRHILKDLLNPKGEAGPDIKQGIKAGVLGGLIGVLYNIPAGGILSMPEASILSRSVIGGIGAAGSAVAIPPVIKGSKESFEESILGLEAQHKLLLPKDPAQKKKYLEKLALKELNARIGMASSIKATHPVPLAGTGGLILAGEALGIPREYVQTAYMALAPVMHNFLRLIYTGIEKYWTIPQRMKQLRKLVYESKNQRFTQAQMDKMDQAFLGKSDRLLTQGLTNTAWVLTTGGTLLAAEVLYFFKMLKGKKPALKKVPLPQKPLQHAMQAQLPIWAIKTPVIPVASLPQLYGTPVWQTVPLRYSNPVPSPFSYYSTVSRYPYPFNPSIYKTNYTLWG